MSLETWIAYAVATEILLIIPGPTVLLVIGYALTRGRGPALWAVVGSCLGMTCAFAVTFAGLGAVLAASATVFTVMKWVGAAYLVYLGVQMWRAKADTMLKVEGVPGEKPRQRSTFLHGFITTILNPKVVVFLVAFVPQFMNPAAPALPQAIIMTATFVTLAFLSDGAYAVFASKARQSLMGERTVKWVQRTGGSLLIGAGLLTAATKRVG
ncbi:LysE family translocator [Hwanghaeella grinnelliae]|uniref:LysE family translocator n=1 Tax=Hwanghaeella grinnelliae TaxID=2500179 RepID=A0A437QPH3_9PROT|nr:LysE family translocator [Hwanghaeella grinnelliae]RVU36385.1 LysE family translocator [Hwanghaeella grinnelliae]